MGKTHSHIGLFITFVLISWNIFLSTAGLAQISITPESDANVLANALVVPGTGITVTSAVYQGSPEAAGLFVGGPQGIADGIILATGLVTDALPPNDRTNTSTNLGFPGSPECEELLGSGFISFDAATLILTFDVAADVHSLSLEFIFGSEEFPEFINNDFNDAFGGFLNGTPFIFDPGGNPITPQLFRSDPVILPPENGLEYDGATVRMQMHVPVTPGSTGNTLLLVICDALDANFDSGVLIASLQGRPFAIPGPINGFAPQLTCPTGFTVSVGDTLAFTVEASDADSGNITLDGAGLPAGAVMNPPLPATGNPVSSTFTWAPDQSQVGTHQVAFVAVDSTGLQDSCSVTITVESPIDVTPPLCELVSINPGPPVTVRARVQDGESGLARLKPLLIVNALVTIDPFVPGTRDTVNIVMVKEDERKPSFVVFIATDVAGNATLCDPVTTVLSAVVPEGFELKQNFPNPFNPSTTIHFAVGEVPGGLPTVNIRIYDITGREVRTLVNEPLLPGTYSVVWDGTDNQGQPVAGGVYIYRMVAGDFVTSRKMMLIK